MQQALHKIRYAMTPKLYHPSAGPTTDAVLIYAQSTTILAL
jgi:hypothetical protein